MSEIPGTGMDMGSMIRSLQQNRAAGATQNAQDMSALTGSFAASDAARTAKAAAVEPAQAKIAAEMKNAPGAPKTAPIPDAPKEPAIDPKEMQETLSLITGLAALGGALTRQPLTAALNSFSAGVHGFVQGKRQVFDESLKQFKSSIDAAKTKNDEIWKEYKAAKDKHGTNVQALTQELQVIAAKYQLPIDAELIRQGRIVDVMKLHEKANQMHDNVDTKVMQILGHIETQKATAQARSEALTETKRHHEAIEGKTAGAKADSPDKLLKDYQAEKRKIEERFRKEGNKASDSEKANLELQRDHALAALLGQFKGRGMGGAATPPAPGAAPAGAPAAAPGAPSAYKSAEDVKAAVQSGALKKEQAIEILKSQFGMT